MGATETSVTGEMGARGDGERVQLANRGPGGPAWESPRQSRILFAVAEAVPFAKVGGLADVGAALPRALAARGHAVRVVLPGYPSVGPGELVDSLDVPLGRALERVDVYACGTHHGVTVYALANGTHFDREMIYGYEDDVARFTLFSKAAATFGATSGWRPHVVHANDWHTGLLPEYARRAPYRTALGRAATVLTIHNLAHQGPVSGDDAVLTGLDGSLRGSLIAQGIAAADAVNTVSNRYMAEILTPEYGEGLDQLLQSRRGSLSGILNGIDYEEFDPGVDPHIPARYGPSSLDHKGLDKRALQLRAGLTVDPRVPLLGMVSRLVDQKGLDLLSAALRRVVGLDTQVVVMGVGETRYRVALEEAASSSDAIAYFATSREELARLVYAGSDLFLAPSNYEPCGLGPLIALRYASIPIVRRTGGMAETIPDYTRDSAKGLGFTFLPKSAEHLVRAVKTACDVYADKGRWRELQRRAMEADFSWARAAAHYERMYREAALQRAAAPATLGRLP
jgi:starch synthase